MVLENFLIDADILWDRVGKKLKENSEARAGRKMRVKVINSGIVEDLTGYTLNLGWHSSIDETKFGLDAFEPVDITEGIFEIEYTSGMLSNYGRLVGTLQLVPTTGQPIESNNFNIMVKKSAIDPEAIQSETSFTALAEALVTVNSWNDRIDVVEQDFIDRANNLDATYPTRLVSLEEQLAQNDNEIRTKTYTSTTRPARVPTVTIMFDDGLEEDYTVLKSIADTLGIPVSIAYITGEDNGANKSALTNAQALELQASGWEIMSHTVSSSNLPAHDDAELERQFTKSKQYLIDNGFAVDSIVYPVGLSDARVRAMTRKHYRAGYGTEQGINVVPLRTQNLYRVSVQDYDLANLKSRVDNIGNGWIVFYAHSGIGTFPPETQQKLIDLVNYIKGKGIAIKTGTKALNYFENTFEIENEGTGESFKVGADGKLYSPEMNALNHVYLAPTGITNDTPITAFKPRSVTTVSFTGGSGSGIPIGNGAGTLITYRVNDDDVLNLQVFKPYIGGKSYERRWLAGNVWGAWDAYVNQIYVDSHDQFIFESMNIFTAASPLTAFAAEKVTFFTVNNANAVGFPNDTGGTCKVVRTQDTPWSYQEYRIINTWDKYIRYPLTESTWSAWKKLAAV